MAKLVVGLVLFFLAQSGWANQVLQKPVPLRSFKKVMIVVLENTDYDKARVQPFLKSLSNIGAVLTNFHGEGHPSQGNYIALTSGDVNGVKSDRNYDLKVSHIGDLLEARGLTWKVYAQGYPKGKCYTRKSKGRYVRKHNPFISYVNVQKDEKRCLSHIVNADVLNEDLKNKSLPDYALYVPDMNNDGHDTGIAYADKWLEKTFGPLLKNSDFMRDMLFVVTFDEDEGSKRNRIYTALVGDGVIAGSSSDVLGDHYSLLRTIEDVFELGTLGKKDEKSAPLVGIWK